jgi:hypothetical protein
VERLVVGLVELALVFCRGTMARLNAVGDAIVSLGRRIAHSFRRQPSAGVPVFIFIIFMLILCGEILRLLSLMS